MEKNDSNIQPLRTGINWSSDDAAINLRYACYAYSINVSAWSTSWSTDNAPTNVTTQKYTKS